MQAAVHVYNTDACQLFSNHGAESIPVFYAKKGKQGMHTSLFPSFKIKDFNKQGIMAC